MDYSAIKEIRKQYGISQTKLAEYSGYTKQLISKLELEKEYPFDEQIKKLEGVLNDLIPKIESGEINLKGHRLVSTQKKSSKNRSYIKDAEEHEQMAENLAKLGMEDAAKTIKEGVADFQKGNMRLGLALTLVKEHLKD